MTPTLSLLTFVFLLTIGLGYTENVEPSYQGLWPKKTQMLEMKDWKRTFNKAAKTDVESSISLEDEKSKSSENMPDILVGSNEAQMPTNTIKGESGKYLSISKGCGATSKTGSIESSKSEEDCGDIHKSKAEQVDISKQTFKRETSIIGNGNRLSNLINLPLRLNVLANVLSKLNQGVLDAKKKPSRSTVIKGNDNVVSSLVNAPIDADAVVNLLSQVDRTKPGHASSEGGVVDSLLGGLLGGGDSGKQDKGLVGGLLGGILGNGDGSGLLGGLVGNTLGDLLGALLGGNGLLGNLLGEVDGKGLVTEVLDSLLGGVVGLVENLLDLLLGLLDGLLVGMANSNGAAVNSVPSQGSNVEGNNNPISSLIDAPIRVKALINVLTALKQELKQQMVPAADNSHATHIQGNNNQISSLINLPIDLNLDLDLLNSSNTTSPGLAEIKSSKSSPSAPSLPKSSLLDSLLGSSSPRSPPNASDGASSSASTNIQGDNNSLSSLLNVVPDISLNLDILSQVTELLVGDGGSKGMREDSNSNEICFEVPISETDSSITGDNNKILNGINVKPKINLDLNLLSTIEKTDISKGSTQRLCITRPKQKPTPLATKPPAAPVMTASPSPLNEICFDVLVDQSGSIINGDNNQIKNLLNVQPNINLGINLLSNNQQANSPNNFLIKRICVPASSMPHLAAGVNRPTASPINPPSGARCFRRTCTRWRQFVDHKCLSKPNDYPKYTITQNI